MDPLALTKMCQGKGDPFPIPVSKKEELEITKASTTETHYDVKLDL